MSLEVTLVSSASILPIPLYKDLRTEGPAKLTFEGKSESARDVQFNPCQQYDFAAAFENGTIQVGANCRRYTFTSVIIRLDARHTRLHSL